jgi:GxxExxY protein
MTRIWRIRADKKFIHLQTFATGLFLLACTYLQMEILHKEITDKILKAFYKVYNELGFGFLERVYENSLIIELNKAGLTCHKQKPIEVFYEKISVGTYFADIVVNECVIIELKAAESLVEAHELQLVNYLKATKIEVGLLLNFGKTPSFKRKIFSNATKQIVSQ